MRIQRLQLENFRGFASLDLDLSRGQTTALVGVNGSGKTAVLKAVSLVLEHAGARIGAGGDPSDLYPRDLRAGAPRCVVRGDIVCELPGLDLISEAKLIREEFSASIGLDVLRGGWRSPKPEGMSTPDWKAGIRDGVVAGVPLLAEFWIDRYARYRPKEESHVPEDPLGMYVGRQRQGVSNRDEFLEWFRLREDFENERFRDRRDYVDPQLEAVRRALLSFLPGYQDLRVRRRATREPGAAHVDFILDYSGATFTVRKDGTLLAFNQLSDGEQGLLVLVGDIARRLAITHPGLADPLQGRGIVLIDEVELHLHPQWQRTLIPNLERAFPNLQFIVTTHSPQVLSLVPREQVKILRDFQVVEDPPHTLGRDSNAILYEVMGVEQYPPFAAEKVRAVARLIDEEKWAEAREALAGLARDFGPNDAEVIRLGSMMEFLRDDEARG